jgi:hypothetical protein
MASTSSGVLAAAVKNSRRVITPPPGYVLKGIAENRLWKTYIASRAHESWLPADLLTLVKIVKLETQLRMLLTKIEVQGALIEITDDDGDTKFVENPNLKVFSKLGNIQLPLMRTLALTASGKNEDKASVHRANVVAFQKTNEIKALDDEDGLLAMPE